MAIPIKNVLISDAVDESCVNLLKENNIKVTCLYKLTPEQLIEEIPKYDGLVVRSDTKVTAAVIEAASNLKVIGRAGTGVDNIDLTAATKKGVIVLNAPTGNFVSACELTCSLILSLSRNVTQACQSLKEGRWDRKLYSGTELYGKTLAVLGLGKIGREVALRMQAFKMKVIGYDPIVSKEDAAKLNIESLQLEQIYPLADYITVHTPLIPQTKNLINADVLKKCKKGVKIINVARGGIVDEKALLESINAGHTGGAAIDVFCEEPPKSEETFNLIKHPKVVVTPHLGASTSEAQIRVAVEIAEQFIALAYTNPEYTSVNGVVNAPALAATRNPDNSPWITLANYLGLISSKILSTTAFKDFEISVTAKGNQLIKKEFLTTPISIGLLSSRTSNGLNLVNVNTLAVDSGLKINYEYKPDNSEDSLSILLKSHEKHYLSGIVKDGVPYLLNIDCSKFEPSGVPLSKQLIIYKLEEKQDLASVINELHSHNIHFSNLSVAKGKSSWLAFNLSENTMPPKSGLAKIISFV